MNHLIKAAAVFLTANEGTLRVPVGDKWLTRAQVAAELDAALAAPLFAMTGAERLWIKRTDTGAVGSYWTHPVDGAEEWECRPASAAGDVINHPDDEPGIPLTICPECQKVERDLYAEGVVDGFNKSSYQWNGGNIGADLEMFAPTIEELRAARYGD